MAIAEALVMELDQESRTTRKLLDRVPSDKLGWKPHAKSMTLGQLASHVASVPGAIAGLVQQDSFDVNQGIFAPPQPVNLQQVFASFEQSMKEAEKCLQTMTDEQARTKWSLMRGDQLLMNLPRVAFVRSIMMNHWYHHRGQLSVYLRLLDVPLPSIYGPSADENPF